MHIVEDDVILPNGKTLKYLREAPGKRHSVTTIAINDKNEILVQREYSYPPNTAMIQLPGGAIEDDEAVIVAANRELSEESGYLAENTKQIGHYFTSNRRSDQKQFVVLCTDLKEYKLPEDPEEFIESEWIKIDKLKEMIGNGEIVNINMLAALNIWFNL